MHGVLFEEKMTLLFQSFIFEISAEIMTHGAKCETHVNPVSSGGIDESSFYL